MATPSHVQGLIRRCCGQSRLEFRVLGLGLGFTASCWSSGFVWESGRWATEASRAAVGQWGSVALLESLGTVFQAQFQ